LIEDKIEEKDDRKEYHELLDKLQKAIYRNDDELYDDSNENGII